MELKPFSNRRAIENDFAMTLAVLIPVLFWFVYILSRVLTVNGSQLVLSFAVLMTLLGPVFFWYRLRRLRRIFEEGRVVDGSIRNVYFYSDRGRIHYTYELDGKSYTSSSAIHRTKETLAYRDGQTVDLVVDPNDPNRAFLRDLYT